MRIRLTARTNITVSGFILTTSIQILNPILAIYVYRELSATPAEVGIIFAVFALAGLLLRVGLAFLVSPDRLGALLLLGLVVNTLSITGYYVVDTIEGMLVMRIIHGAAIALDNTTMLTLIGLVVANEGEIARSLSRYTAAVAMGLMTGPAIATVVVAVLGTREAILASALISAPTIILGYLFIRRSRGIWLGPVHHHTTVKEFITIIRGVGIRLASSIFFLFSVVYGVFLAYAPLIAGPRLGLADEIITILFLGYFGISFITRVLLPRLLGLLGAQTLLILSLTISAAGLAIVGLSGSPQLFILGFELIGIGHGITFPVTAIIAARTVAPQFRVLGNAIYLGAWDVGTLLGPLVGALLAPYLSIGQLIALAAIAPLAAALLALNLKKTGIH